MQKRMKMLLSMALAVAMILSVLPWAFATETEHEHEWIVTSQNQMGHGMQCNICEEVRNGEHTFDDSGICTLCGFGANDVTEPEVTEPEVTEPEVTEPEVTEPVYVELEESWFDDALFIGDSRTAGLKNYYRLGKADYFTKIGMNI